MNNNVKAVLTATEAELDLLKFHKQTVIKKVTPLVNKKTGGYSGSLVDMSQRTRYYELTTELKSLIMNIEVKTRMLNQYKERMNNVGK